MKRVETLSVKQFSKREERKTCLPSSSAKEGKHYVTYTTVLWYTGPPYALMYIPYIYHTV